MKIKVRSGANKYKRVSMSNICELHRSEEEHIRGKEKGEPL
jgi:hypothetical protein